MSKNHEKLGRWAVIDIETTGADPAYDEIIDVGFLEFEGIKLVSRYESLVRYEGELSYFIQKLTGIKTSMVQKAPRWKEVEPFVTELYGAKLLAHNAEFERSFLEDHFSKIKDDTQREEYLDSLPFLALLFPYKSSLKLENFIIDWKIADKEEHRGLQDSIDMLKVLLVSILYVRTDKEKYFTLNSLFQKYHLTDWWYYSMFNLFEDELFEIADQIDFDLEQSLENVIEFEKKQKVETDQDLEKSFSLEFSGENIKGIFENESVFQRKFSSYKFRKSQVDLSIKTGQSFKNKVHALIQAPTGTGKTLGYLVPAALFALENTEPKKQVLIATGTKTLQQQAMSKDVPHLRELLGVNEQELKVKRLIGSSNHLCELLFRQNLEEEDLLFDGRSFEDKFTDIYFEMLFYYNARNEMEDTVLRDDLPFVFKMKYKEFLDREKNMAVDFRSCTGSKCPFHQDCTYVRGLREARDANIIVGNHSLMFSWPRSFPRPEYIIVDEAHKIEDETTSSFSLEVSQESLEGLSKSLLNLQGLGSLFYLLAQYEDESGESTPVINQLRAKSHETHNMIQDHLIPLKDSVETFFKKRPRYTDQFWNELPMINPKSNLDALSTSIFNHLDSLRFILRDFSQSLTPYISRWDVKNLEDDSQVVALTRFETFAAHLDDIHMALEVLVDRKEGYSHSLKYHGRDGFLLNSSPIDVGKLLHDQLLQTSASVVFTSATLGNAKGDQGIRGVEWATGYSNLAPEKRFRTGFFLPATYDYESNTRVFLCDDVPNFYDSSFVQSTLDPVLNLIKRLEGRTLLLYSARSRFETAREILLKEFEGKIPLFIQGMGSNVVDEFKKSESGILLGMESFGEGIDIPGEALQFVFVDKIPDLRMDLVINDRRDFYETNLGNEFTDYYLAHRTRKLHQKLGRLIRREGDIGGVIIVDSRVKKWKGRTMEQLTKLMEPYKLRRATLDQACLEVGNFVLNENTTV